MAEKPPDRTPAGACLYPDDKREAARSTRRTNFFFHAAASSARTPSGLLSSELLMVTAATANLEDARAARGLPPGPPPRRGVVRSLRYYAAFARDPIGFVKGRFDAYGDSYYAPNADGGLFVFRHPDHLREVLSTKASAFSKEHTAFSQLSRVLGEGLLTSDGETWTRQRRMIGPAFASARIAEYGAVMVDEALETVRRWEPGGVRAINDDMTALTLRVVSRALFGHDVAARDIDTIAHAMACVPEVAHEPGFLPKWMPSPGTQEARVVTERRSTG